MGKKKENAILGRAIIKDHAKRSTKGSEGFRHTSELNDGSDWAKLNLKSVTEQTNLNDFLDIAELAGTEFTAEKENIKIISEDDASFLLTPQERIVISEIQEKYKDHVQIPRRPKWDKSMNAAVLDEAERQTFLEWRRGLAELKEKEHIFLTPYEKNLQFWRQLWRVVERSNLVVQILDARNPLLFRCEDLEKFVLEVDLSKVNVLLLNKADHLTLKQRSHWFNYFAERNLKTAFYSALLEENETQEEEDFCKNSDEEPREIRILSGQELIDFFKDLHPTEDVLTVGLVGYPNVGKSSTINSLLKSKKVSVSATPGKTKHFQTLFLNNNVCLCDCPGLVFPSFVSSKADMIVSGILPIDQMTYCLPPMALIASLIPKRIFQEIYGITLTTEEEESEYATKEEILNSYGYARGFMTQRGLPDISRAARVILKDFVNGKLLYCTAPPGVEQHSFHQFPYWEDGELPTLTPAQMKLLQQDKLRGQDLENSFFQKVNLQAHKKLKGGKLDVVQSNTELAKPWKKHHNKNKKQKLRRVYSELDV